MGVDQSYKLHEENSWDSNGKRDTEENPKHLRKSKMIPAVVYGNNQESTPIKIVYSTFLKLFRKAWESSIITLMIEKEKIESWDKVTIDTDWYDEKWKLLETTSMKDYPIIIGSWVLVPWFEEWLIWKNSPSELELDITFPKDYHNDDAVMVCFLE